MNDEAASGALMSESTDTAKSVPDKPAEPPQLDIDELHERAKAEVLSRYEGEGLWDEDVECLNVAITAFV